MVNKKTNSVEVFSILVDKIHEYKMSILGNFMFGFDHDTENIFNFTKEKIIEAGLDSARFSILTPYPGTPLFNKFESEGRILSYDWSKYNRKNVVFKPKNMSPEVLQNGFLRLSQEYNSLSNILSREFKSLGLGFYPFLASSARNLEGYMFKPR